MGPTKNPLFYQEVKVQRSNQLAIKFTYTHLLGIDPQATQKGYKVFPFGFPLRPQHQWLVDIIDIIWVWLKNGGPNWNPGT